MKKIKCRAVKASIAIALMLLAHSSFAQRHTAFNDNIVATYDMLNGQPFAALDLEDTAGNIFNTTSLLGKTVYVDFWFTACAPCVEEIPHSNTLQQFFAKDTDVVFLCICIESTTRKPVWKQMIHDRQMQGIQLFYARNRPQKINLIRQYHITFPTYVLVNKDFKVIGYNAPRPQQQWTYWAIEQARHDVPLSDAHKAMVSYTEQYRSFMQTLPTNSIKQ